MYENKETSIWTRFLHGTKRIHDKYKRHNKLVPPRDMDEYIYVSFDKNES